MSPSALVRNRAVGGPAGQRAFLNAAARLETSLPPAELLARLQRIEWHLGRTGAKTRWAARTLDLDLLLYDDLVLSTPYLTLPHPRMAFRRFVLEAAAEVAPEMATAPRLDSPTFVRASEYHRALCGPY